MTTTTGFDELAAKLEHLAGEGSKAIAMKILGAGASEVKRSQRSGEQANLKGTIGSRITQTSTGYSVTVGVGVGSGSRDKVRVQQALWYSGGTGPRQRTKLGGKFSYIKHPTPAQLSTGAEKAHGQSSLSGRVFSKMQTAATAAINKEFKQ